MTDTATHQRGTRKGWILAVIGLAQLMVVLDATIVNIALPRAQDALGISNANRQWVVTAYTLTFGGLLLLGGRIADYWGRKRSFIVGLSGFAIASGIGGLAVNQEMLYIARAGQGIFGALLAPAALSLLTTTFEDGKERAKAFAVFGAVSGSGAAIGLLLGGILTEYLSWHWCLLVNVPLAIICVAGAFFLLPESSAEGNTKYDIPGAVTATLAIVALVYGFTHAAENQQGEGWSDPITWLFIAIGVVIAILFVVVERTSKNPLLPLRIVTERNRAGALLVLFFLGAALIGGTLFLTFYFQQVLGYSPIRAGAASLGITAGVMPTAIAGGSFLPRFGPRPFLVIGALLAAAGLLWLTTIGVESAYWTTAFPGMLVLGIGMGFMFTAAPNLALSDVSHHDAGAASAALNATQQIGGSLGTGFLNAIVTGTIITALAPVGGENADPMARAIASVDAYHMAFYWSAGFMVLAAVVGFLLVNKKKEDMHGAPEGVHIG